MDKDFILNTWIPALRSGKYRQAKEALHSPEGFCCLGVACDLIDPEGWSEGWSGSDDMEWSDPWGSDGESGLLSPAVAERLFGSAEMTSGPRIMIDGVQSHLVGHNDTFDHTFEQIADGLEAWVKAQESAA